MMLSLKQRLKKDYND